MLRSIAIAALFASSIVTTASVHAAQAGASGRAAGPRDEVVCRRFVRTGSLVDSYRVCKTRWEWQREQENVRSLNSVDSCRMRYGGPSGSTPDC